MADLHLYGHGDSGHAHKVALALRLAKLLHRLTHVDIWAPPETRPAEFLAQSPFAEVPLLLIDGEPYVQSGAILLEIATRFGVLGGESHAGLVRARELILWEANRIGMCLPQLCAHARGADGFNDGAVAWLRDRYAVDATRFDILLGDAPFFHGATPGIGDCAIWGYSQWLDMAGLSPSPAMQAWLTRMRDLPETKGIFA